MPYSSMFGDLQASSDLEKLCPKGFWEASVSRIKLLLFLVARMADTERHAGWSG